MYQAPHSPVIAVQNPVEVARTLVPLLAQQAEQADPGKAGVAQGLAVGVGGEGRGGGIPKI